MTSNPWIGRMSSHSTVPLLLAACAALSLHPPSVRAAQNNGLRSFEQSYEYGVDLLRQGKPLEAFRVLDEGLKADPQNPRLLNAAGSALMLLDRVQEATSYFKRAITSQPHFVPARKNLGISLWTLGKVNESREQFELVLKESAKDSTTYLFLGLIASKEGQFEKAIQFLKEVPPGLLDSRPEALLALAGSYFERDRSEEGLATVRRVSRLPALPPRLAFLGGKLALEHGAYNDALTLLKAAEKDRPEASEITYGLALAHYRLGQYQETTALIQTGIQNGDQTGDIYNLLGWTEERIGNTREAVQALRHAVELEPDREDHYLDLSTICLDHEGGDDLAGEIVDIGLQKIPNSYHLLVQRGVIFEKRGRHADALRCFEAALRLHPSDPLALLSLGIAHWQANELREAVTAFSEGTRRFPADYRFFYFYGLTSQKLIEVSGGGAAGFESARTALQRSIALNPEFPYSHFILGKIWAKTGQTQQAQKEFERTVSLNPNHVEVKYWLSKIYRQSGRNKEAAKLEGEVQAARRQKLEEESQMRIVLVRK